MTATCRASKDGKDANGKFKAEVPEFKEEVPELLHCGALRFNFKVSYKSKCHFGQSVTMQFVRNLT